MGYANETYSGLLVNLQIGRREVISWPRSNEYLDSLLLILRHF